MKQTLSPEDPVEYGKALSYKIKQIICKLRSTQKFHEDIYSDSFIEKSPGITSLKNVTVILNHWTFLTFISSRMRY